MFCVVYHSADSVDVEDTENIGPCSTAVPK